MTFLERRCRRTPLSDWSLVSAVLCLALWSVPTATGAAPDDDYESLTARFESPETTAKQREWLVPLIAALGSEEARDYLVERFFEETARGVRRVLVNELMSAFPPLASSVTRKGISDPDPYLRYVSLETMIAEGDADAEVRARDILRYEVDWRVRAVAIRYLAGCNDAATARLVFETCTRLSFQDQRQAIQSLARLPEPIFRKVIADNPALFSQKADGATRLLAALILTQRADRENRRLLRALTNNDDRLVAFAAGLGLDRVNARGTGTAVKRVLGRTRDLNERCHALAIISQVGITDPGLTNTLIAELWHGDWRLRAAAADALRDLAPTAAVPSIIKRLKSEKVWQVQVACHQVLGASRQPQAIEYLLASLDDLGGRVHRSARESLTALCGVDLGDRSESWRVWWDARPADFEPPPLDESVWAELDPVEDKYEFYGIEVYSTNVAFVLDTSGSMQGKKLVTLQKQLAGVLEQMPDSTRLNMIFFDSLVKPWQEKLVPLTRKNRNAAMNRIRYLVADGSTDLWGGMEHAMESERVDSVYLLSDGQPTTGKISSLVSICDRLREMNRHKRVVFHVVLIGYSSEDLRRLAVDSGGSYVEQG